MGQSNYELKKKDSDTSPQKRQTHLGSMEYSFIVITHESILKRNGSNCVEIEGLN